uniref:Secreted protein n=1 Tax=Ascaris lumbricoides TaxID=6252 RepID=A0A0M3HLA8_ASCLU
MLTLIFIRRKVDNNFGETSHFFSLTIAAIARAPYAECRRETSAANNCDNASQHSSITYIQYQLITLLYQNKHRKCAIP